MAECLEFELLCLVCLYFCDGMMGRSIRLLDLWLFQFLVILMNLGYNYGFSILKKKQKVCLLWFLFCGSSIIQQLMVYFFSFSFFNVNLHLIRGSGDVISFFLF